MIAFSRGSENVAPGGEVVQRHAVLAEFFVRLGENVVVEHHDGVADIGACGSQRIDERDLAAAVCGEVLDQEDAFAVDAVAFDLSVAAEAFGFFFGRSTSGGLASRDPGGKRDACGLAAGDAVEGFEADVPA